jgi:hypothetical protein
MGWVPQEQEVKAVLKMDGARRCEYFVKRVVDTEQLWSLRGGDGWVLMADDTGTPLVPVWPHERYAQECADGDWADCQPSPIALEAWLRAWTPGLEKDGRQVAVFPTAVGAGVVLASRELEAALREEMENYE